MKALLLMLAMVTAVHAAQPNIVILYADDMGYGDLGANNPESKIPTPNLDRLAAEGMRFTDGHSTSGICTPSRYSLLTGRYHWRDFHGIAGALEGTVFKKGQLTLPAMLREKGYTTACIGKWHLGWDWDAIRKPGTPKKSIQAEDFDWSKRVPSGPLDQGFDHYFGDAVINFPPYAWIEDDKLVTAPDRTLTEKDLVEPPKEGQWECRPGPAVTGWDFYEVLPTLTEKGVEYVRAQKGKEKPFFLYLPFPSPHAPIIPNDEFDGKSGAGAFGDFVFQTDDACGRIMRAIEEIGESDNTIIIFTADNGAEYYAFERDKKYGHWSSAPFRGLKRDIYEGGHHVPFLVKWPGVTKPGSVSDALISQTDLLATFASLVGYELPENAAEDSFDFLPFLLGEAETSPRKRMVHNTKKDHYALRDGEWNLVNAKTGYLRQAPAEWDERHGYSPEDGATTELYHFSEDPGQRQNLAEKYPEKVKEMQAVLKQIREQGHSAPRLD